MKLTRVAPLFFKARFVGACLKILHAAYPLVPISLVRFCHNHRWCQL